MTSQTSDSFFCFGPTKGSFILDTPKRFSQNEMPSDMSEHLTNKVQKIYYAAVNNSASVCSYKDVKGNGWHWESNLARENYPDLCKYLGEGMPSDVYHENVSVTFGDNSYIACRPTANAAYYLGIGETCSSSVQKKNKVRLVALGINTSYVLLHDTSYEYYIASEYPLLHTILGQCGDAGSAISFVALNPWVAGEFFLVVNNNTVYFSVDASVVGRITELINEAGMTCHDATREKSCPLPAPVTTSSQGNTSNEGLVSASVETTMAQAIVQNVATEGVEDGLGEVAEGVAEVAVNVCCVM